MSFKGRIIGAVVGVAIAGGILGVKEINKASAESDVRLEAHSAVQEATTYVEHQAYHDEIFEEAHEEAFEVAYDLGAFGRKRFRVASFDRELYYEYLFQYMTGLASLERKEEIARSLRKCHENWREENDVDPADWEEFANH